MREPQSGPLPGRPHALRPGRAAFRRRPLGASVLAAFALTLAAVAAAAQTAGEAASSGLEVVTVVEKLPSGADGDPQAPVPLAPAAAPEPGDSLIYTVKFTNASGGDVDNVRITKPIPAGVRYVEGSASGPGCEVLFSVDGGRTFGEPSELFIVAADGARRAAQPDDYTHIRWRLRTALAGGAAGFARFRAVAR